MVVDWIIIGGVFFLISLVAVEDLPVWAAVCFTILCGPIAWAIAIGFLGFVFLERAIRDLRRITRK